MTNLELAQKIYKLRVKRKQAEGKIDIGSEEYRDLKTTLDFYEKVLDNMGSISKEVVLMYLERLEKNDN